MRYERESIINRDSGQGEVWLGRDETGEQVAIKYVKLPVAIEDVGTELRRFEREIKCQNELDHPNIVKILHSDLDAPNPYFVMPLAEGSLRDLLPLHPGGMSVESAVPMIETILEAVAFAHRGDVLHRDLKPENILIYEGVPAISDFGLGRRLQAGSTTITVAHVGLGTWAYSAPEQLMDGHSGDKRSDVYSLGRIVYELLTGRVPFPKMDVQLVPAEFRHFVFKATRDESIDRYQSVNEMIHDLKVITNGFDSLRTPLQRAEGLFEALQTDDSSDLDAAALSRLLIEQGDNEELCGAIVTEGDAVVLGRLAEVSIDSFDHIVDVVDRYATSHFDFDFVDQVAELLIRVFEATDSIEIRTKMLRRLLLLGASHNRFHIADRFSDVVSSAIKEQVYVQIVADMLQSQPAARTFVERKLRKKSLPSLIEQALAA